MHYESRIWAIADLLRAASVKQSDFPAYMMPFFALMMLEGRMLNAIKRVEEEEGLTLEDDPDDFKEAFIDRGCGYNEYIVMKGKTLRSICSNDTTFEQDFAAYLKGFDPDLKQLLGIDRGKDEQKYLNIDYYVAELRSKKILLSVVSAWSLIDISPYDNSAITTLEEHIKRKWADMSASTAGEQYTPDDIISLISDIVATKMTKPKNQIVHVYDPTCGGANLLFGVADRLTSQNGYNHVATYGSEYNDALYALAAIESRFRNNSQIHYGNTLTTVPFEDKSFDVIVANPPYGTKWDGYQKDIKNDQKGQFPGGLPPVNDGQLLFMQHILWKLDGNGIAVEVHNGSALFSGEAGKGGCNIRKYIFDHDWVEAIIQMPQNEFFNTGIYTYLWIMNKKKPVERKDKVALIDGSNLWQLLKKAKGDKRREMNAEHRSKIVESLTNFQETDICKIFPREYFYYNQQSLTLTELNDEGHHVGQTVCKNGKAFSLKDPESITIGEEVFEDIPHATADDIETILTSFKGKSEDTPISISTSKGDTYTFLPKRNTIEHTDKQGKKEDLGCGEIALGKSNSKKKGLSLTASIKPMLKTDYEIIPHHFDAHENEKETTAFMQKHVTKPYKLGKNIVGVELSFNKEYYVPEKLENVDDILNEIQELEQEMKGIEL